MNGPSKNLSWKELACHDGTPYPRKFIDDGRVYRLAQSFEDIRSLCGNHPITILSAYRTPEWNKKIGGAKFSQHVQGRALDLKPPIGYNVKEFYNLIRANCADFGINGIGLYVTFVHIDIRPSSRLVVWSSAVPKETLI